MKVVYLLISALKILTFLMINHLIFLKKILFDLECLKNVPKILVNECMRSVEILCPNKA